MDPALTARTRVRRLPEKQVTDRVTLDAILDAGLVAHVGIVDGGDGGQPYVLPCAYARDGDRILIHGSIGSRLFRLLAAGAPVCLTVTLLDGLVYARSLFESSMQYRSAMVLGGAALLDGEEKPAGLKRLAEHLMPGRWAEARRPNARELAATLLLALPIVEWSVKVSAGPPDDDPADLDRPVWAGVLPLHLAAATPVAAPDLQVPCPVPDYVSGYPR